MLTTKVSIVISAVGGREELLERSLWCYSKQTYQPMEIIVVMLRPKDIKTKELIESYQDRLDVRYYEIAGPDDKFMCGYGQNKGIVESTGDVIIVVPGPEIMFEFDAVQAAVERLGGQDRACATLLFIQLSELATNWLRHNPQWRRDANVLRKLVVDPINEDAKHSIASFTEDAKKMLSWIRIVPEGDISTHIPVMTRNTWLWMGGFRTFDTWGPGDGDFVRRRRALGMTHVKIVSSATYHQYHSIQEFGIGTQMTEYKTPEDAIMELKWRYEG